MSVWGMHQHRVALRIALCVLPNSLLCDAPRRGGRRGTQVLHALGGRLFTARLSSGGQGNVRTGTESPMANRSVLLGERWL